MQNYKTIVSIIVFLWTRGKTFQNLRNYFWYTNFKKCWTDWSTIKKFEDYLQLQKKKKGLNKTKYQISSVHNQYFQSCLTCTQRDHFSLTCNPEKNKECKKTNIKMVEKEAPQCLFQYGPSHLYSYYRSRGGESILKLYIQSSYSVWTVWGGKKERTRLKNSLWFSFFLNAPKHLQQALKVKQKFLFKPAKTIR